MLAVLVASFTLFIYCSNGLIQPCLALLHTPSTQLFRGGLRTTTGTYNDAASAGPLYASATSAAWLPIASLSSVDTTHPLAITVAGNRLVVWQQNDSEKGAWSVFNDACPHRLAPLSEGRVDPKTNCLECPYHGQQFDGAGKCTLIPQLDEKYGGVVPQGTSARSYPTRITGDVLWSLLPLPKGDADSSEVTTEPPTFPDEIEPLLLSTSECTVRELPYSIDFLVENFMDPAHIPFAHHSLQSVRSDGCPIDVKQISDPSDASRFEIEFTDTVRGKTRLARTAYRPPAIFTLRSVYLPSKSLNLTTNLMVLMAPIVPGKSRAFIALQPGRSIKLPFGLTVPKWLLHGLFNKFLDSDIWIHDQERFARGISNPYATPSNSNRNLERQQQYIMTTSSDMGPRKWRSWWERHQKLASPVFGGPATAHALSWLSLAEQRDRIQTHVKHCKHCQRAVDNARLARTVVAPLLGILAVAVGGTAAHRVTGLAFSICIAAIAHKIESFILGPGERGPTSAAQFGN